VRGLRIHARVAAAPAPGAPRVVLVHGLVVSSASMVPVARVLAADHEVRAPDLPGFGRSEWPRKPLDVGGLASALGAWMDADGAGPALLVANSMGCQVAADLAARRPDLAHGLVLAGPAMDPDAAGIAGQAVRWALNCVREPPGYGGMLLLDLGRAGPWRGLATLRRAMAHRLDEVIPSLDVPVTVVRGEADALAPRAWAERLVRLAPRGRLEEVPGVAHSPNWSAPEALAAAIRAASGGHPGAPW
jgi:pimeloyl-ACP methyl ester carboxylesterase